MSVIKITPVVLCGGAGSRLWPMSRDEKPKQFHALFNEKSLLANTIARTPEGSYSGVDFAAPIILGNASLRDAFEIEANGFETAPSCILLEPSVRDTAAAIAAVTAFACKQDPNSVLLVLPSDARIDDHDEYRRTIAKAARVVGTSDSIMTLGIRPSRPETQYGYIEQGEPLGEGFSVQKFREKPDLETAQDFLSSGNFLWNAGIFMFRAGRLADDFSKLQPEIWKHASASIENACEGRVFFYLNEADFNAAPKLSMDYAIMEKAENIGVVPAHFDWDDLGSWAQLYESANKDVKGNAAFGDSIIVESQNNYIRSDGPLVAAAGIEGLTIVAEDNKVLVSSTQKTHLVKDVNAAFKNELRSKTSPNKDDLKRWLFDKALPFWVSHGMDFEFGGAYEALSFSGAPAPQNKKRLRVTARQIYCYAHASMMGWQGDADKVLRHCLATLIDTGWHQEGGFIHLYNPDGTVQDQTRDTYDQCFVLLAMAWLWRSKKWPEALEWGEKTLAFMDEHLADPEHGGYFENLERASPRRANPHMHFLEAMLAWYDATENVEYLDRAEKIVSLFINRFYDTETCTLTERFNDDWSLITDQEADHLIEPGHHYEWAWLLLRYNKLRSTKGLEAKARGLYATANAFGHHHVTGAAADTNSVDGTYISNNARCWPQTEALKASIAFEKTGVVSAKAFKQQMLEILMKYYIDGPIVGGWYDAIDAQGKVSAPDMPSSTFYHIYCALAEYIDS
ncbi:MAG: AGE family epimerase/isomerase [Pseudomonadota bacterium]